jgi:hypothetical protein
MMGMRAHEASLLSLVCFDEKSTDSSPPLATGRAGYWATTTGVRYWAELVDGWARPDLRCPRTRSTMPEDLAVVAFDGTAARIGEAIDLLSLACGEDSDAMGESVKYGFLACDRTQTQHLLVPL